MKKILSFCLFLGVSVCLFSESTFKLKLEHRFTIGKSEPFFNSIDAVYEDSVENFYVLDKKAFKVYKFSKSGKLLLAFGNKGEGPGDTRWPGGLSSAPDGSIIINEDIDYISFFDKNGRFLKRIKVPVGLGLHYLNDNLFYAWVWNPDKKQQALIDQNGKIVKNFFSVPRNAFSINVPDETGRYVMFNFFAEEYTPFFVFNQYKDHAIIGVSDKYEILLINRDGKLINKIHRDIKPGIISPEEKKFLEKSIKDMRKLPDFAKKKFVEKIPAHKNYFNRILVSDHYIWIFRVKEDISKEDSFVPVDLYTMDMKFKGTLRIKNPPVFVSAGRIYFVKTDGDDDLLLEICKYSIE